MKKKMIMHLDVGDLMKSDGLIARVVANDGTYVMLESPAHGTFRHDYGGMPYVTVDILTEEEYTREVFEQ